MSATRYYRCDSPATRAALLDFRAQIERVHGAGRVFAAMFEGTPLYRNGLHGVSFYGLCFKPSKPVDLWTKPDAKAGDCQRPRNALPRNVAGDKVVLREQLKELQAWWKNNFPKEESDFAPLLKTIGLDWGNLLIGGAHYLLYAKDDAFYIATPCSWINDQATEITGSQFDDACKAMQS